MDQEPGRDFFISYTGVNKAWACWIAVQLEGAGYTTWLQAIDMRPGTDFVHAMQEGVTSTARTIAVLSPAYFGSRFAEAEWRAAFARDPMGELGVLVPVRVQPGGPPGLLATRVFVDLVDLDEAAARDRLLAAVAPIGPRPTSAPFPGGRSAPGPVEAAPFPGAGPAVMNLGARNRNFTGRDAALVRLHDRLDEADDTGAPAVAAVHGLGGVGKTALALEFAHRFASDYDLVWWIAAEQPTIAAAGLAKLAEKIGISADADQAAAVQTLFDRLRARRRWLLIYDNAERPATLSGLLPTGGGGHVLVTSRWLAWSARADPIRLDVLDRTESVSYLQRRTGSDDQASLAELAALVGDLPLALAEAAGFVEQTGSGVAEYLGYLRTEERKLFGLTGINALELDTEEADHRRVATVWSVSLDRIRARAPAAESLITLYAFLDPDVPRVLPTEYAAALPPDLAAVVADPLDFAEVLRVLGEFSMVILEETTVHVHRLVQAVVRARLGSDEEKAWARRAVTVIRARFPDASDDVRNWVTCEQLLPHLLAAVGHAERLEVSRQEVGWLLDRASTYQRGLGQYRQALPLARRALKNTCAAVGSEPVDVASRHDELGRVLRALADFDEARAECERALQISEAALGPDHPETGARRGNLGLVLGDLGDLAGARTQLERALQIREAALGSDHPDIASGHNNLGLVLSKLGDVAEARTHLERALQIGETALGRDHPATGAWRSNLGAVLYAMEDLPGARIQFERALEISEAALRPDHPDIGIRRADLGALLSELGDLAGARTHLERALQILEAALGPDHPDVGTCRGNLGAVLKKLGDLPGARTQMEHALRIGQAVLGPDHVNLAMQYNNLGTVLRDLGDIPGARTQLEHALRVSEAALGPDHRQSAWIRQVLDELEPTSSPPADPRSDGR